VLGLLLAHDFLLAKRGIALPQAHGLRAAIERNRASLQAALTRLRVRRRAATKEALEEMVEAEWARTQHPHPRWVRVNTLRSELTEQLETTFTEFERVYSIKDVVENPRKAVYIDEHVPNLVAVSPGIDFAKSQAYVSGAIILQDKASCFPAYLLDPHAEDGDVIDTCAAPGNKTTHLAAIIHSHRPEQGATRQQRVFAFEKNEKRARTLEKMIKTAGSKTLTRIGFGQNFLKVNPEDPMYRAVGALLLDPSCSGSGIVGRDSMPELHLPESPDKPSKAQTGEMKPPETTNFRKRKREAEENTADKTFMDDDGNVTVMASDQELEARLAALSAFQLSLLLHAFKFPAARKITYSTCSVHAEENEHVVTKALGSSIAKERGWRLLSREQQIRGMREWPVRGSVDAAGGDVQVAEGCIRAKQDDGRGVMGFFVAGFVRDGEPIGAEDEGNDGPYVRDQGGLILRDVMGMPVLKATGLPVSLAGPDEEEEEDEEDEDSDESEDEEGDSDDSASSGTNGSDEVGEGESGSDAEESEDGESDGSSAVKGEWHGIED
jgi:25S rRNA (cytosine2278-C5)-methyltransferase